MERCALEVILLDPLLGDGKDVLSVAIKAHDETAVHLNAMIVQDAHSSRIIFGTRGLFAGVRQVIVG